MFHIPAHKSATAAQVVFPDWAEGLDTFPESFYPDELDPAEIAKEWERAFYSVEESHEG